MSCFCCGCFTSKFHSNTASEGWRIANLKAVSNASVQGQEILPQINEHVAAVYDRAVYVGRVIDMDDSDAHITFYQHNGGITHTTVFRVPNRKDEVWVAHEDILCILPVPNDTKRGKKFDQAVVEVI